MKASVRLGVLAVGLVMVVGLALGAAGRFASPVSAQVPVGLTIASACTPANVAVQGQTTCTTTISNQSTAAVAFQQVAGVGIRTLATGANTGLGSNPIYGQVTILNGASSVAGPNEFILVRVNNVVGAVQGIEIGCVGATCDFLAGDVVTITEVFTGAVGGSINHQIQFGNTTGTPAFGTAVTLAGGPTVNPATLIGSTITTVCAPLSIAAGSGATSTCTTTLTDNDIFPTFVAGGSVRVAISSAPTGTTFSDGSTIQVLQCGTNGAPQSCQTVTTTLKSNPGGQAGTVSFAIDYTPSLPAVDAPATVSNANVLTITTAVAVTVTKVCTPPVDGVPDATFQVRVGGVLTCVVTAANATAGTATVNLITFQGTAPVAAFVGGGQTATFTCAANAAGTNCSFTEQITPLIACISGANQSITLNGITYQARLVNAAGTLIQFLPKAGTGGECAGAVANLLQPDNLVFRCGTNPALFPVVGDPRISPIPGDAGGFFIAGIGVLPEALVCKVIPQINGVDAIVAPAKIEVSSVNGTLIDASGRLTTNLRIECGNISGVLVTPTLSPILPTINKNNCVGVQFAVTGLGVGFVDLNARYEPAAFAVADGIIEIEAKAQVAFIAPFVSVNLGLSPNPVVVGATGTATSRFNRTTTCATGVICIDPTTGLPIAINLGSALNGTVIYTIDDSLVATWAAAQPTAATGTPSSTAGFQTSANQQAVRCGFLPSTTLPSPGLPSTTGGFPGGTLGLSFYFGGCETTTATYLAKNAGVTNITATFVPDLPGAFGSGSQFLGTAPNSTVLPTAPSASIGALVGAFANGANPSSTRALEVVGAAPVGDVQLARGCNNVSPTVTESASAYAARVNPSSALVAIWEHQAATNTFRGWSPATGAPNDLAGVTRLRPVFVCVSGAAALSQPPA